MICSISLESRYLLGDSTDLLETPYLADDGGTVRREGLHRFQLAADMLGDRISVTRVKLCSRTRGVRFDAVPLFRLLLAFWLPLTRLF